MNNGYDWIHKIQEVLDYDLEKLPIADDIGRILVLLTDPIDWSI